VVDSDVDEVTEAVAVADLAEEAARTRRKNGVCLQYADECSGLFSVIVQGSRHQTRSSR